MEIILLIATILLLLGPFTTYSAFAQNKTTRTNFTTLTQEKISESLANIGTLTLANIGTLTLPLVMPRR